MRLSDIDGPHDSSDNRCHLQAVLAGLPDVVVEATDRAGRTLVHKIDRQQTLLRLSRPLESDGQLSD